MADLTAAACEAFLAGNGTTNGTSTGCDTENAFKPNVAACIGLSACGGCLEVVSTMCLAYPEFRKKRGATYSDLHDKLMTVANLLLMLLASGFYVLGQSYGSVSLAVPTIMASKLLCNLVLMGAILRMDEFSREQQVGVYCIVCAILTLPEIGPSDQDCLDGQSLVSQPMAVAWEIIMFAATVACIAGMVVLARRVETPPVSVSLLTYVTAQVVSAVINASASKMFTMDIPAALLGTAFGLAIVCAAVNVISLMLAAKHVDQGVFIPFTTSSTLIVNMITGLIVWEEWRVIETWMAYIIVHLIMVLGICLLAPSDVMEQYRSHKRAELAQRSLGRASQITTNLRQSFVGGPRAGPNPTADGRAQTDRPPRLRPIEWPARTSTRRASEGQEDSRVSYGSDWSARISTPQSPRVSQALIARARAPTLLAVIMQEGSHTTIGYDNNFQPGANAPPAPPTSQLPMASTGLDVLDARCVGEESGDGGAEESKEERPGTKWLATQLAAVEDGDAVVQLPA